MEKAALNYTSAQLETSRYLLHCCYTLAAFSTRNFSLALVYRYVAKTAYFKASWLGKSPLLRLIGFLLSSTMKCCSPTDDLTPWGQDGRVDTRPELPRAYSECGCPVLWFAFAWRKIRLSVNSNQSTRGPRGGNHRRRTTSSSKPVVIIIIISARRIMRWVDKLFKILLLQCSRGKNGQKNRHNTWKRLSSKWTSPMLLASSAGRPPTKPPALYKDNSK